MIDMQQAIQTRLAPLNLDILEFEDQSYLHVGHAGNKEGGHYAILLVSQAFEGVSHLARQRQVQTLLSDLFAQKRIHALSIVAQTPSEYFNQNKPF